MVLYCTTTRFFLASPSVCPNEVALTEVDQDAHRRFDPFARGHRLVFSAPEHIQQYASSSFAPVRRFNFTSCTVPSDAIRYLTTDEWRYFSSLPSQFSGN